MISSVPSSRCRRALARAVGVAGGAVVAALAFVGCSTTFEPTHKLIPGPSGAIAASPLSAHRVAILAGTPQSKGVFIVDTSSGELVKSFGVTKEATGIVGDSENSVLLTVGGQASHGKPFGAVERWMLSGAKSKVVPMPAEARGITSIASGTAYVLVGNGNARAALPLSVPSLAPGKPVALEAGAKTMQQCTIGSSPYLLYSGGTQGTIAVREVATGIVVRSTVVADSPVCVQGRQQVFALSRSFAAASIDMLSLPNLLQQGVIPASNDAVALYDGGDGTLIALNASTHLSNIEIFPTTLLTPKSAK